MTTVDIKRAREVAGLLDKPTDQYGGSPAPHEIEAASLIRSLCEIVEKLPVTADGVYITNPFTNLWRWTNHASPRLEVTTLHNRGFTREHATDCYSTREAALAAAGKEKA